MTVRAFHRTSAASAGAVLRDGFEDREGTYMTDSLHAGVCVTIERPGDLVTGESRRPARISPYS